MFRNKDRSEISVSYQSIVILRGGGERELILLIAFCNFGYEQIIFPASDLYEFAVREGHHRY